jgi:hypothetical protein
MGTDHTDETPHMNDQQPNVTSRRISRRRFVIANAAAMAGAAGCIGGGDGGDRAASSPGVSGAESGYGMPRVEDPPDAVYVPTHRAGMKRLPDVEAGEYVISPMLSHAHRFWLVTGTETEAVTPDGPGIHLMFTVWDADTGRVLPVDAGAQIRVSRDGEPIDRRAPWPMISQTMGFHFGDNVPLTDDGTYTVDVSLNPIGVAKTGAFEGRFEDRTEATFRFEYDDDVRRQLVEGVTYLDEDRWGREGAIEPMMRGRSGGTDGSGSSDSEPSMAYSALPPADAYPGRRLGTSRSGDATFVLRYLEDSRFVERGGYLLVSPRTPYNRVPLPDMALSIEGADERDLTQTLDSELGLHYGAAVDLSAADELRVAVETPPQVARHAGYETAFVDMEPIAVDELS